MPIRAAELEVVVGADTKPAEQGLRGAMDGIAGKLHSVRGTVVKALVGATVAGIGALGVGIYKSVEAAMDAQKVQTQLAAVIKSTGGVAGWSAEQANRLAESLMQVTGVDDETIVSAQSLLLTFTKIGGEIMPQATEAALDMAQTFGMDVSSAAIMLGKALNDPVAGVGALRRVGVSLTKEQEEQIEEFVKLGDVASAQKVILKELARETGGSAREFGRTFAGQLAIVKANIGNISEEVGMKLLPVLNDLLQKHIVPLIPKIAELAKTFADNLAKAIPVVVDWLTKAIPVLEKIVNWFTSLPGPVLGVIAAIAGLKAIGIPVIAVISQVVTVISTIGPLLAGIGPAIAAFGGTLMTVLTGPVGIALLVIAAIAAIAYAIYKNWDQVKAWLQATWEAIKNAATSIWTEITTEFQVRVNFLRNLFSLGVQNLQNLWTSAWNVIQTTIQTAWARITGLASQIVQGIRQAFSINWLSIGSNIISGIINGIRSGLQAIIDAAKSVAQAALDAAKKVLGISSPSKAFMGVAENIVAGWVQGLQAGTPVLQAQMGTLARGTVSAVPVKAPDVSASNRVINVTINNPTPEKSEESVRRALHKLSYLGVLG